MGCGWWEASSQRSVSGEAACQQHALFDHASSAVAVAGMTQSALSFGQIISVHRTRGACTVCRACFPPPMRRRMWAPLRAMWAAHPTRPTQHHSQASCLTLCNNTATSIPPTWRSLSIEAARRKTVWPSAATTCRPSAACGARGVGQPAAFDRPGFASNSQAEPSRAGCCMHTESCMSPAEGWVRQGGGPAPAHLGAAICALGGHRTRRKVRLHRRRHLGGCQQQLQPEIRNSAGPRREGGRHAVPAETGLGALHRRKGVSGGGSA